MVRITMDDLKDIVTESVIKVLNEAEWNFHYGKDHNGQPYVSDNKYQIIGRDTGHFGSGTYFSTYSNETKKNPNKLYVNSDSTPEFIKVDNGVYRVDMSFYKNLYRVTNTKHGYVLFSLLKLMNNMYNKICYQEFDNSQLYQKAQRNAEALNLNIPPYRELIRMMQNHQRSNDMQSFSTVFMEYNGYNGVNVSNIPEFDNDYHGSVIYDLSKVENEVEQVKPKFSWDQYDHGTNMVIPRQGRYGMSDDIEIESMYKELYGTEIVDKLNSLPLSKAMRILKNNVINGRLINPLYLKQLNLDVVSHFLRYVFSKRDEYSSSIQFYWLRDFNDEKWFYELIDKTKAYYWVNYNDSIILGMINNYYNEIRWEDEIENKLTNYINNLKQYKDEISPKLEQDIQEMYDCLIY